LRKEATFAELGHAFQGKGTAFNAGRTIRISRGRAALYMHRNRGQQLEL